MDGAMWMALVIQYIDAINGGTVPSIESSWSYICKHRFSQGVEELKRKFSSECDLDLAFPCSDEELEKYLAFKQEKLAATLIGLVPGAERDLMEQYLKELGQHLKEKGDEMRAKNLEECRMQSSNTLNQLFHEVNQ